MKVLLVASTARGHAIADALHRSPRKPQIFALCPRRNPGLLHLAEELMTGNIMDFSWVLDIARSLRPDFAIIGPDDPIGAGLTDALQGIEIPTVAPTRALARIESSKGFTRMLLQKHGIDASPRFHIFEHVDRKAMTAAIEDECSGEYVVKYDALKGGKGVKVSGEHLASTEEGVAYAIDCVKECGRVVIEEKLAGVEFSLMSFVSGEQVVDMPAVQDHKRAYEGDTGPNTGGMGTYSDADHALPFLAPADLARAKEINRRVAAALLHESREWSKTPSEVEGSKTPSEAEGYRGILYGGFMAVRDGVRLIEYNARFGDPEALNVLPILSSDFVTICQAILSGELSETLVTFERKATVCKVVTPRSYPENKAEGSKTPSETEGGQEVMFPLDIPESARVFFGDVTEEHDGVLRLGGSRAAGIVGIGRTIAEAEQIAQALCEQVEGPVRFRSDIGTPERIQERTKRLRMLRTAL